METQRPPNRFVNEDDVLSSPAGEEIRLNSFVEETCQSATASNRLRHRRLPLHAFLAFVRKDRRDHVNDFLRVAALSEESLHFLRRKMPELVV